MFLILIRLLLRPNCCLPGRVHVWVRPMHVALVPDCATLAFVSQAPFLFAAAPTVHGSESFRAPQLHPACFLLISAPGAGQQSGCVLDVLVDICFITKVVIFRCFEVSLPSHRRPLGDSGKSNQHSVWPLPLLAFLLLELFKLLCRLAVRSNLLLKHRFDDSLIFWFGDLYIGRDCRLVACDPHVGQPPEVMPGFVVEPPFLLFF